MGRLAQLPVFARGGDSKRKRGEILDRPMKQGRVWEKLRDAFYVVHPTGHIVRIEDQVGRGTPDVYCTVSGRSVWVEIKTGYQQLTDLQRFWHSNERGAGGVVLVLTVRPNRVIMDFGSGPEDMGVITWTDIVERI